jgi:RNA polymerase sigma-70 factor (ECF subfamily)
LGLAQAGDRAALGRLLERYRNYLALLARWHLGRRLRGKVDSSDLVQETFLQAQRGFALFRGATEGELVAWLRQLLASRLAKALRRYYGTQRRDVRLEQSLADDLEQSSHALGKGLVAPQSSPSQQAARREQAVLLADALAQLPDDYREVILVRHFEGLPLAEVASRMGRSVESVRKLWTRALGQVRRILRGMS